MNIFKSFKDKKKTKSNPETDAMWTTPWAWRDEDDVYVGTNTQVWMYRTLPVSPMEWEDDSTRLSLGARLASLLAEIGATSVPPVAGLKSLATNREIHIVSTTWEVPVEPPKENSANLKSMQKEMFDFTAPRRALLIGVRLRQNSPGSALNKSTMEQAKSIATRILAEDVPDTDAYAADRSSIAAMMSRAGASLMTRDERNQLEAWYNKGNGPDTTLIEHMNTIEVPAYDTFEMSAVMRFNTKTMYAPDSQWLLEAASHRFGPSIVSVRAELEPASVTRNRSRKSQRKLAASIAEQDATGDLERAEYREGLQEVEDLEGYIRSTNEAMLTKCSILLARPVRPADETYMDYRYNSYGIEVKPLEHRQLRALDEMLPCSSRRINPFIQDVNIAMLAYAGLNGFSNIGDSKGMYAGVAHPDYTPVYLDPAAASLENKPAAMLVAGDSGSGKSFLCQMLAIQAVLNGETTIFINPKGFDSLEGMAKFVNGKVVKMSALEEEPGAFDPFRYAPGPIAAEIATNHILSVLGGPDGLTQEQQLMVGAALKKAGSITDNQGNYSARCVGDAFDFMTDESVKKQIMQQVESSSLFALGIALEPLERFTKETGLVLIEFDRKPELPDPTKLAATHTRPERIALASLRLVTRASLEMLSLAGGGVLIVDEAWTFLSSTEGLAALTQLGREGRSLRILPIFATQRVADVLNKDMESYISRVFCLKLKDPKDAAAALDLCGLEPTPSRIAWLANCGPTAPAGLDPGKPAMSLHRDIKDRHSAVMIWPIPENIKLAISTNPADRARRDNIADPSLNG